MPNFYLAWDRIWAIQCQQCINQNLWVFGEVDHLIPFHRPEAYQVQGRVVGNPRRGAVIIFFFFPSRAGPKNSYLLLLDYYNKIVLISDYKPKLMIYFIRHAESLANRVDAELTKKYGKELFKNTEEYLEYKFNPKHVDVPITEEGMLQARKAQEKVRDIQIDAVLVSPMRRALQTCSIVFQNHKSKPEIIVEPFFRTILEATNDIGGDMDQTMKMFPNFNFSRVKDRQAWYIHTLYQADKQQILKEIGGCEGKEREGRAIDALLPIMRENWFQRGNMEKEHLIQQRLLPSLKEQIDIFDLFFQKYKNIAVVSHGECIKRYAGYKINNCQVYPFFRQKLGTLSIPTYP